MTFEPRPYDLFPTRTANAAPSSSLSNYLSRACSWLAGCSERHRQRMMLRSLDDRLLADIGLTRADVSSESAKWPWQLSGYETREGTRIAIS
jgi:uncharacterized protein YjiS (DUF1127 family)